MFTLAKWEVPKTALGQTVRLLLARTAGGNAVAIKDGDDFSVSPHASSTPFKGLAPLLSVASTGGGTFFPNAATSNAATRAAVQQWCMAAEQLSKSQLELAEMEARFALFMAGASASDLPAAAAAASSKAADDKGKTAAAAAAPAKAATTSNSNVLVFLAGTDAPTVADLMLLTAVREATSGAAYNPQHAKVEAPTLARWAALAVRENELCREFGKGAFSPAAAAAAAAATTATAASTTTASDAVGEQKNAKSAAGAAAVGAGAGVSTFEKGVAPTAAEIAARQAEKVRAKAEKERLKAEQQAAAPATAPASTAEGNNGAAAAAASLLPSELDLRVGKIVSISVHPTAQRLYVESIDLGEASGPRQIISGLVQYYKPEELLNALVVVVCNMKPAKLQGLESCGMVLCACTDSSVKIIEPPQSTSPGMPIQFGGGAAAAAAASASKPVLSSNKMAQLLEGLRVNDLGMSCWKEIPFSVGPQNLPVTSALSGVKIR